MEARGLTVIQNKTKRFLALLTAVALSLGMAALFAAASAAGGEETRRLPARCRWRRFACG